MFPAVSAFWIRSTGPLHRRRRRFYGDRRKSASDPIRYRTGRLPRRTGPRGRPPRHSWRCPGCALPSGVPVAALSESTLRLRMRPIPKPQVGSSIFFEHCYRWLKPAGVLVLVVPGDRLAVCGRLLAFHFKDKKAYRLGTPEAAKYKRLLGTRRTRRECNQLSRCRSHPGAKLNRSSMSRKWEQLPVLPDSADAVYSVPERRTCRVD